MKLYKTLALVAAGVALLAPLAYGHGDVVPQPFDTTGLDSVGTDWLKENPYRVKGGDQYALAIKIGASAYNQNCARCHGLEVKSGGLAPDLRYLEKGKDGDEWFINRIRHGYQQDGITKMPAFEGIFTQDGMWAIRSYLDSVHEE